MSEESLLRQNEMLLRKVEFLNKIIALKDNTINDLNSKLLALSQSQAHQKEQTHAAASPLDAQHVEQGSPTVPLVLQKHRKTHETTPAAPAAAAATAAIGATTALMDTFTNTPNDKHERRVLTTSSSPVTSAPLTVRPVSPTTKESKDVKAFEIPQRNSGRSINTSSKPISRTHSQLIHQQSIATTPTPSSAQSIASTHVQRESISSIASSKYSDNDEQEKTYNNNVSLKSSSVHTPLLNKYSETIPASELNESHASQHGINTLVLEDSDTSEEEDDSGVGNITSTDSNQNEETATTSLKLELKKGHLTLGSSPRKLTSARTSPVTNFHNHTTDTLTDDGLNFNPLATPKEPTYTKVNTESLFSSPSDLHVNVAGTTDNNGREQSTPKAQDGNDYDYFSSKNILSRPSLNNKTPPILPPVSEPKDKFASPQSARTSSSIDGEKFLLNSLEHSVIRIESLIDPIVLSSIHDGHSISYSAADPATKIKYNTYKVSFMVYTNENSTLTPIYRVKKTYRELIVMDKTIRPMLPSLPYLPTLDNLTSMNIKERGENKKNIQAYINSLLIYLKSERQFNHHDPVWKNFSNYFEFKIDTDLMDFENAEYSVMNLQEKITYLAYSKRGMSGHRTYDFVRLSFPFQAQELSINFILSKSTETVPKDEIHVTFRGQEITIKRKKKFTASKTWVFFAESDYDASDICSRLATWIGASENDVDDDTTEIASSTEQLNVPKEQKSTASPSINAPWKLFKKSSKQNQNQSQTQLQAQGQNQQSKQQQQQQQQLQLTSPRPNSALSISAPSSPSKMSYNSSSASNLSPNPNASPNDIMTFRAIPYDSKVFNSETMLATATSSRLNLLESPVKMQAKFQPIDDTPRYFKSTLQHSFDLCSKYKLYDHKVPSLVYQCITFLYQQSGEGFEGIFRLNGMMSEVNKIQEIFNTDYDCDLSKLTPLPDVHSIATLLKRYLRNLKDRLISDDVAHNLCQIIIQNSISRSGNASNNTSQQSSPITAPSTLMTPTGIDTFHDVFQRDVPTLSKSVLYVLFRYLKDVLKMGKHNKMTVSAMSVLMGPNLTQADGGGQICIVLLENFSEVFA